MGGNLVAGLVHSLDGGDNYFNPKSGGYFNGKIY